jgi:hypothetical protein
MEAFKLKGIPILENLNSTEVHEFLNTSYFTFFSKICYSHNRFHNNDVSLVVMINVLFLRPKFPLRPQR